MEAPHSPPAHDIEDINKSLGGEKVCRKEEAEFGQAEGDIVADTLRDISADVCNCPHNPLTPGCPDRMVRASNLAFQGSVTVKKDPSVQSLISDCSWE